MAEDEEKKDQEKPVFTFNNTGEEQGYISMETAEVLALEQARADVDFYGLNYQSGNLVHQVTSKTEGEDYYDVRLSFRPLRFRGRPGLEQFIIDKVGAIRVRQVLELPQERRLPVLPLTVAGLVVAGAAAVAVVFLVTSRGGPVEQPVVAAVPTAIPVPPTATPAATPSLAAAVVVTVEPTPTPVPPTATPTPTAPRVPAAAPIPVPPRPTALPSTFVSTPTSISVPIQTRQLPIGDLILVAGSDGAGIYALDARSLTVNAVAKTSLRNDAHLAWNPIRREVYVAAQNGGVVSILLLDPLRVVAKISDNVGWNAYSIAVNPDGTSIFVTFRTCTDGQGHSRIVKLDPITKRATSSVRLADECGSAYLALSPDGERVYVSSDVGIGVYTTVDMLRELGHPNDSLLAGRLSASPDGRHLYIVQHGRLLKWDLRSGQVIGSKTLDGVMGRSPLLVSHDGSKVWVASLENGNQIYEVRASFLGPVRTINTGSQAHGLAESTDGSQLYVTEETNNVGTLKVYELISGAAVRTIGLTFPKGVLVIPASQR